MTEQITEKEKAWQKEKEEQREREIYEDSDAKKFKDDQELVEKINLKRKLGEDLTFKEKLRVAGFNNPTVSLFSVLLLPASLIYYWSKVSSFESGESPDLKASI